MSDSHVTSSPTIGFRLPRELFEELRERAERAGQSVHEAARSLVIQSFDQEQSAALLREIEELRRDHRRLRKSLAKTVEAMFLNLTDVPAKQAREWATQHILHASTEKEED